MDLSIFALSRRFILLLFVFILRFLWLSLITAKNILKKDFVFRYYLLLPSFLYQSVWRVIFFLFFFNLKILNMPKANLQFCIEIKISHWIYVTEYDKFSLNLYLDAFLKLNRTLANPKNECLVVHMCESDICIHVALNKKKMDWKEF